MPVMKEETVSKTTTVDTSHPVVSDVTLTSSGHAG